MNIAGEILRFRYETSDDETCDLFMRGSLRDGSARAAILRVWCHLPILMFFAGFAAITQTKAARTADSTNDDVLTDEEPTCDDDMMVGRRVILFRSE